MSIYVRLASKSRKHEEVKKLTEYILDPTKTRPEYCHAIGMDVDCAFEDVIFVKQLYCQTEGRQALHWVVSCDKGVTADVADSVGVDVLHLLDGKYQGLCATHLNTENYHTHIMINPVNMETGNKFNESKADLRIFRNQINDIFEKHGLSRIGDSVFMQDEEWDETYEYAEDSIGGELNDIFDEMERVHLTETHLAESKIDRLEINTSEDDPAENGSDDWQQTWVVPQMFSEFNPGAYALKTVIAGNIYTGNAVVEDRNVLISGILRPNPIKNDQHQLIRGVTYENEPNSFDVFQYVDGKKFTGKGQWENGRYLVSGIFKEET